MIGKSLDLFDPFQLASPFLYTVHDFNKFFIVDVIMVFDVLVGRICMLDLVNSMVRCNLASSSMKQVIKLSQIKPKAAAWFSLLRVLNQGTAFNHTLPAVEAIQNLQDILIRRKRVSRVKIQISCHSCLCP